LERLVGELAHRQSPSNESGTTRTKRQTKVAAPSAFTGKFQAYFFRCILINIAVLATIAKGIVLNNNILSPQAFTLQLMRPRAVGVSFFVTFLYSHF
jgi:hypothetical protein